ncbi:MAG: PHA/PHB synthase family protein [Alphaproteobacteria bacterium]
MGKPKTDEKQDIKAPDPVVLANAIMVAYQKAQPVLQQYIEKYSSDKGRQELGSINFDPLNIRESYLDFLDKLAQDPAKFFELQTGYMQDWANLWQESINKMVGSPSKPVIEPEQGDRRFKAAEWSENALFDFIKQSYLLTCRHMENSVNSSEGLSEKQREKLRFQAKLFSNAISPTNFAMTNPDVINETMKTGGENLVKGFENLIKDLERGHGDLSISTTNYDAFEVGKNIAVTEGRVVYQNDLMQLIQYSPMTENVFKTPLLIVPPWINKYYILDLRPGNSLIEWAVEQGHTVFAVSWVNPDKTLAKKSFEDYMLEGVIAALNEIESITGEKQTNVIGYCLGGTLLAITLAYLTKKKQDSRIKSATFLTTLLDFDLAGDIKLFLDDDQLKTLDKMMDEHGFLDGKELHRTFAMLRTNDMIWSFVVNNYLMGKEPFPFDLLYWNDDSTNMPAAMHRFYLRNMYRDNKLKDKGGITIDGVKIDLSTIQTPCHFISTKEDHIAPWIATYAGTHLIGSNDKTFTLAASGHIAGIVNPPSKNKYCYWVNDKQSTTADGWFEKALQFDGSWWAHWQEWISNFTGEKMSARTPPKGIEAAPGSYVKVRN